MRGIVMALLAMLSTADLERLDTMIGEVFEQVAVVKAAAEDPHVEEFRRQYVAALGRVLRGQFAEFEATGLNGEVDEIMREAERLFGPEVAEKLRPHAERYLKRAAQAGQSLRGIPDNVQTLWDAPRKEALEWLVEHDRFWIGRVFPRHLEPSFRQTVTEGLQEGLGRKDIARRLRNSVIGTTNAPAKLEYYTRIASANINRARNWGSMFSLETAGVETYTWRAVGDERTCPRCSYFDGQSFSVAPAMSLVRAALDGPPEQIESLAPWPSEDRERDDFYVRSPAGREYVRGKSAAWLQERGMGTPPLHAGCRCVIVAEGV